MFFWGFANLAVGALLAARNATPLLIGVDAAVAFAGAVAMGIYLALHFGKVQREK
jgi:hypothetical protein